MPMTSHGYNVLVQLVTIVGVILIMTGVIGLVFGAIIGYMWWQGLLMGMAIGTVTILAYVFHFKVREWMQ